MGLENSEQESLYTDFWFPMEKNFGHAEYSSLFDRFMRDYLTIKTGKIPNINDVYSAFKLYAHKFTSMRELVSEIYKYSKYFVNIALEKEQDADLKNILSDINSLKVDVSYPFILQAYDDYQQEIISKDEFAQILKYIESYVFRRAICGIPTNSLNKTFSTLYKEIRIDSYFESFKAALLLKDSYRRFPRDNEFKEQLIIKDVYHIRTRNYLLKKLENHNRKEFVNVDSYTIEHILPQNENLSVGWQQELGENWQEIQEKYLHTIGNLTLTGYNSELSDKLFLEKRNMTGGFSDSPIRLNNSLAKLEHWNEDEIVKRANEISILATSVWKSPDLDQTVLEKYKVETIPTPNHTYTLSDHQFLKDGEPMRPLFDELRKRILNIDSEVKEEIKKIYIAYKSNTNFSDVIGYKSKLLIVLNLKIEDIKDPKNICRDISGLGRWGNGDVDVSFSTFEELDYVMTLVKQAFDHIAED